MLQYNHCAVCAYRLGTRVTTGYKKIVQGPKGKGKVWDRWGPVLHFGCYRTRQSKYPRRTIPHIRLFPVHSTWFLLFVSPKPSFFATKDRQTSNPPRPNPRLTSYFVLICVTIQISIVTEYHFLPILTPSLGPVSQPNSLTALAFYWGFAGILWLFYYAAAESSPVSSQPKPRYRLVVCELCPWSPSRSSSLLVPPYQGAYFRILLLLILLLLLLLSPPSYSHLCTCPYSSVLDPSASSPITPPRQLKARSIYPAPRHCLLLLSTLPLLARYITTSYITPSAILGTLSSTALVYGPGPSLPPSHRRQLRRAIK